MLLERIYYHATIHEPYCATMGGGGGACLTLIFCSIFHYFGLIQYSNIYFYIYNNIILFANLFLLFTFLFIFIISNYYYNNIRPRMFYYKANNILENKLREVNIAIGEQDNIEYNILHNEHNNVNTNTIVRNNVATDIIIYNKEYCFICLPQTNRKILCLNIDVSAIISFCNQNNIDIVLLSFMANNNIKILDSVDIIYENDYIINIISSLGNFTLNAIGIIIPIIISIIISIISK